MTVYKHFTGQPRPNIPESAVFLGEIITQHMTRTECERWYSDDPEKDKAEFEETQKRIKKYNQNTMPPIWM